MTRPAPLVEIEDPTPQLQTEKDSDEYPLTPPETENYLTTKKCYPDRDTAEQKTESIANETGLETKVIATPVDIRTTDGTVRETFDPEYFPFYDPIKPDGREPFDTDT